MSALWHPFADMGAVAGHEVVLVRGEGVFVWDDGGKRYLDGAASLWYANVGHGRREIADAIVAQLSELESFHVFGDLANRPALELAERIAGLAPEEGSKVFLTSGGGESIETATKLARNFHLVQGAPERRHLISREGGYHGTHGIGTSILGLPYKDEFGPLVEQTSQVDWDDPAALEAEIERLGAETVAAFVFEPVIGSGGVLPPPAGYLEAVTEICRRHGVLTIADSVIGGFGRLGTWLGVERFDLRPDLIVLAKGITSGYLPLGGVVVSPRVAEPFWGAPGRVFAHGSTYAGHPACCAAGLANLDLLAAHDLVGRARELETPFHRALSELCDHEPVGDVRGGVGLMAAVALAPDVLEREPDAPRPPLARRPRRGSADTLAAGRRRACPAARRRGRARRARRRRARHGARRVGRVRTAREPGDRTLVTACYKGLLVGWRQESNGRGARRTRVRYQGGTIEVWR